MTSSARYLHHLLMQVEEAEGANLRVRWASVLAAEPYSVDFSLRHAAVVGLWRDTVGMINALPASPTRERRLTYAEAWWQGIVLPDVHWGENKRHSVLNQAAFDMLDTTAEYLEQLDGGAQPTGLPDDALRDLRTQAEEWIDRVQQAEGLSRGLGASLIEHLQSVIWLIDNVDRFGSAPIVAAAEQATGGLIRAGFSTLQPAAWAQHLAKFVAAMTLVATGLTQTNVAIDQAQEIYREIESARPDSTRPGPVDEDGA